MPLGMNVLVLSRNYPNREMPLLGPWVEQLVRHLAALCDVRVIAPVPYCPPLPAFVKYTRFRRIPQREQISGVDVRHPRFLVGPGYSLHSFEAAMYYQGVVGEVDRLRREFPFDVIHAHFSYPDGVVAARLGQRYGVPVVITEHAYWRPWMDNFPRVRRQSIWAAQACAFLLPVSRAVRRSIVPFTGELDKLQVVPVGVDASVFTPLAPDQRPRSNQIVFVGRLHFKKGVDILLRAMPRLIAHNPAIRLILIGGDLYYPNYRHQTEQLYRLAQELDLQAHVEFLGPKPLSEVAQYVRESAALVLPSRSETFGSTLVEALACGTPVVATRCGGPEDIVTDDVGVLVPPEDDEALTDGILHVLAQREQYLPARLRARAIQSFTWEMIARQMVDRYYACLAPGPATIQTRQKRPRAQEP